MWFPVDRLLYKNPTIRSDAAKTLGEEASPEAVPYLINAFADGHKAFSAKIVSALKKIGPVAVPQLLNALQHENASIRSKAALALCEIGDAQAVPDLEEGVHDKNWTVRTNAIRGLGLMGPAAQHAVPLLVYVLESEDRFRLACNAALSLWLIGEKSAVSVLKESLKTRAADDDLHLFFAMGLGLIDDLSGLPILAECLRRGHNESHKRRVRDILQQVDSTDARHALATLEGKKIGRPQCIVRRELKILMVQHTQGNHSWWCLPGGG